MKFRPIRGGLKEAMDELFETNSLTKLAEHLKTTPENIKFNNYSDTPDNRIGWNKTYIVTVKGKFMKDMWGMVGYSDSEL